MCVDFVGVHARACALSVFCPSYCVKFCGLSVRICDFSEKWNQFFVCVLSEKWKWWVLYIVDLDMVRICMRVRGCVHFQRYLCMCALCVIFCKFAHYLWVCTCVCVYIDVFFYVFVRAHRYISTCRFVNCILCLYVCELCIMFVCHGVCKIHTCMHRETDLAPIP